MRILHIINSLTTGGAEKLLIETLPLYHEKGLEVAILLLNGIESPFYKELQSKKCCTIYSLGKGSVYNPLLIFKMIPYLKKFEVIHIHLFPALYFVAIAKLISRAKTPLVYTEHCTSNRRLESKLFSAIDKRMYRYYAKIVCISSEIFQIIKNHTKLKEQRFQIIENGVNLSIIKEAIPSLKEEINIKISNPDKVLIQVSGFREQKDQKTLIKALKYMPNYVKLLLVGDGNLRHECEELTTTLGLQHRVFFLGIRMDVPQLLKTADIVVLSSKYEGLSLSSIEGMASGKPFVASNVPGLRDVVGGAGLLFEDGNEQDLANIINKLIEDADFYQETVTNCLDRAEKYDISYMVAKHIALYINFK